MTGKFLEVRNLLLRRFCEKRNGQSRTPVPTSHLTPLNQNLFLLELVINPLKKGRIYGRIRKRKGAEAKMMDMERIERMITSAARLYREVNKPILKSRIDLTGDVYADEETDEPMISIDVKGEPKIKLLDLLMWGSALLIFLSILSKILGLLRRR